MDDEREGINYISFFDNSKIWGIALYNDIVV
jgi:hypothetical protein